MEDFIGVGAFSGEVKIDAFAFIIDGTGDLIFAHVGGGGRNEI